jgi:EAL domain-containing protein (putative c-di-GMP-specific phosphodiesterase class I)
MSVHGEACTAYVRHCLYGGGLRVAYQPIVNLPGREVVAVEALARLAPPGGVLLQPDAFLHHLDVEDQFFLTQAVLAQALHDIGRMSSPARMLRVSVNVIPEVAASERLRGIVRDALAKHAFAPDRLVLEIVEQSDFLALASIAETRAALAATRALGVRIALDDVGSAYSSLLRLRNLPIDMMKLDHAFVQSLGEMPEALHFVVVLRDLAESLRHEFVAEGVESEDILDALAALGVPFVQGYAIAPPMLHEDLVRWLAERTPAVAWTEARSLLGLYARHLQLSRLRRLMLHATVTAEIHGFPESADACDAGRAIATMGLRRSEIDASHRRFHATYHSALKRLRKHGQVDWVALDRDEDDYRATLLRAMRRS